jgi:hypothetical protein
VDGRDPARRGALHADRVEVIQQLAASDLVNGI